MYSITLIKSNGYGGTTEVEYHNIDKYRITNDFLILDSSRMSGSYYIPADEVLEFELNWQV